MDLTESKRRDTICLFYQTENEMKSNNLLKINDLIVQEFHCFNFNFLFILFVAKRKKLSPKKERASKRKQLGNTLTMKSIINGSKFLILLLTFSSCHDH